MEKSRNFVKQTICELHSCLREPLRICHWAGFFPVDIVTGFITNSTRCRYKLPYLLFHGASVFGQIILTSFSTFWFFLNSISLKTLSYMMFYVTGFISTALIFKLAKNWNGLIEKAREIEISQIEIRRSKTKFWKYKLITCIVMFSALLEHIMSLASNMSKAMVDLNEYGITVRVLEEYFKGAAPFIFNLIPYNLGTGLFYVIINLQATFLWNITDLMIICIGIYLTSFFDDLNHIILFHDKHKSLSWEKIRVFYSQLVALVKEVDSRFCYLILLSFFTNIFFICLQFFHALNYGIPRENNWLHRSNNSITFHNTVYLIYYVYSFAFLMTRATTMCLVAANVHKAAQEPQFVVGYVPASEYTLAGLADASTTFKDVASDYLTHQTKNERIIASTSLQFSGRLYTCLLSIIIRTSLSVQQQKMFHEPTTVQRFNRQVRYTTTALSGVYFYVTRSTLLKVAGTILTYELVLLQFNVDTGLQLTINGNDSYSHENFTVIY